MITVTKLARSIRYVKLKPPIQRNIVSLFSGGNEAQSYSATCVLPYESKKLYDLVADIDNYSDFVPFCKESRVTKRYQPDEHGNRWPAEAILTIGWFTIEEKFTSKITCIPGSVVEAISGDAKTSMPDNELLRRSPGIHSSELPESIFHHLRTKWTIKPYHYDITNSDSQAVVSNQPVKHQTEVNLKIDFKFSNPLYASMSKSVTPNIVGIMIEAFQKRAFNHINQR